MSGLFVCALPIEVSVFKGDPAFFEKSGHRILASGAGEKNVRETIGRADFSRYDFVFLWGYCGSLVEDLKVGDLILCEEFSHKADFVGRGDAEFALKGNSQLAPGEKFQFAQENIASHFSSRCRLLTSDNIVQGFSERRELARKTGAQAVDMESFYWAKWAYENKKDFFCARGVLDDLNTGLDLTKPGQRQELEARARKLNERFTNIWQKIKMLL